jgi:arginyl-tRNA synthetase
LGALKYFILKVDPKKNMLFNPEESIDFNGNTGTFIQYTYARIQSVLRKAAERDIKFQNDQDLNVGLSNKEKDIIKRISMFPDTVREAGAAYSPALIANFCYELVKEFNQFYQDHSILHEPSEAKRNLRLLLSLKTGQVVKKSMQLLGIEVPDRM